MQRLLDQLDSGGEGARADMEQVFPDSIYLEPDLSGKYLIAVLNAGGIGQLLYDWHDNVSAFGLVENSMVAGALYGLSLRCRNQSV